MTRKERKEWFRLLKENPGHPSTAFIREELAKDAHYRAFARRENMKDAGVALLVISAILVILPTCAFECEKRIVAGCYASGRC